MLLQDVSYLTDLDKTCDVSSYSSLVLLLFLLLCSQQPGGLEVLKFFGMNSGLRDTPLNAGTILERISGFENHPTLLFRSCQSSPVPTHSLFLDSDSALPSNSPKLAVGVASTVKLQKAFQIS